MFVAPGQADDEAGKADSGGATRVELKVTLDPGSISRARSRLGLWNSRSEERDIWFYDTPGLDLFAAGAVLRARDIEGAPDDSTVKLRPLDAAEVGSSWLALAGFKCEIDRLPDRSVESCSLTVAQGEDEIEDVAGGERDVVKLFSDGQERFLDDFGPAMDWDDLVALGPVFARVWKLTTAALPEKLTAELWYLPEGDQVLELSMKVDADQADAASRTLDAWLAARGLVVASTQETKTRRALEELAAAY